MDTISALGLPFEGAIRFFRAKANVKTKHWYDVYTAAHSRMFMVAGAATDALVEDLRRAVDKAISEGTTLEEFRRDFDEIVARNGWTGWKGEGSSAGRAWRTQIIYDTNLRTAYAAGRYAAMTAPETLEVFPYWQYRHSGSSHPRWEHLSWDGLVLRADDTFWASNYPPNGWHCGCYVTPVSRSELRRQGKAQPDNGPDLPWVAHDIGGKRVQVPQGVDPGFEYNPGQEWLARTAPGKETVAAAPGIIERFVKAAMAEQLSERTYIPLGIAPESLAQAYGVAAGTEIRLSTDTILSHLKHAAATPEIYANIVEIALSEGTLVARDDGRVSVWIEANDRLWLIGMKRTKNAEVYVTTVHPSDQHKFTKMKNKGKILRK